MPLVFSFTPVYNSKPMNKNFSLPIRYGLIGGFIVCIISVFSYLFYRQLFSGFVMQAIFGFAFLAMLVFIPVWGTVSFKRELGKLTFQQAFLCSVTILAITLFFSGVLGYLIPNVIDPDYPEQLHELITKTTAESMEKFGAPDDKIEETLEAIKLEDFTPTLEATVITYGKQLGMGIVLSVLIALFVSRPSKDEPIKATE